MVKIYLCPVSASFCQTRRESPSQCLGVSKQENLKSSTFAPWHWVNSDECLCLQEQQQGIKVKADTFLREPLSFAMNPVSGCAAQFLRLSCTLHISIAAAGAARKGSCLRGMLRSTYLSKFNHEWRIVGICPWARKVKIGRNGLTRTPCLV